MKTTLYQSILDHYREEILQNRLQQGDRIPTEHQIAEIFNVSRTTAMRAVKELELLGMVSRLKKRGTIVNHKSEFTESKGQTPIIAMIIPFNEQIGFDLIRGAAEAAKRYGCYVTFHSSLYNPQTERELGMQLQKENVRGIIVYPCGGNLNLDFYSSLLIDRFPFVIIDRKLNGLEVPLVTSSNFQGAYDITNHLIELGHKRIAFFTADSKGISTLEERFRGYTKAMIDAKIPLRQEWIIDMVTGEKNTTLLQQLMEADIAPTAIVAANDMLAIDLLKSAIQVGIRVPDQLSITGFDNLEVTGLLDIPLTTIQQPFFEIGARAVELLCTGQSTKSDRPIPTVEIKTRLIQRSSTAAPPLP